ncbi:hypothetical protein P170DRAFT_479038 [Aspergillus steynii IBT 23096]|uniref:Uncharacterized protein n=1 Tax=Aspergillus steynii IBT 23096 TaxID=1392250 RepID=A0A2I2FZQ0_9EURO|nr:uncharacterized protein P170DRAFT_479038 [Aspergillus steynii IBT 23096]PLB46119.1 hypothetical protein P170DRAFT_479038 [Aspergillus steynii IBT 23096]
MSSNNPVSPSVAFRQHLDQIIQYQHRRERMFNLPDLHAFFYKRVVERRRPAEEEHDSDVASSSAHESQQADLLADAAYPEFSLFGHIYPDIPDTDSDSTEEFVIPEIPPEAAPRESTAPAAEDITSDGPSAVPTTGAPTHEAHTAQVVAEHVPTGEAATADTSVIGGPTAVKPTTETSEWLVYDPEWYDSEQWETMENMEDLRQEIDTSADQAAVSTGNEDTTTPLYPHLPLERQTFLHGNPDSSSTEPFPSYYESYDAEASRINEETEQAYTYALSKVAESSLLFEDMSFRQHLTPFAPRAPPTFSPNVNPDLRSHQGPSAWPRTPVRPRNTSRFFPGGNTPTRARYAAQNPQSTVAVVHAMSSSEILSHASSSVQPQVATQPIEPAPLNKRLIEEAIRSGRISSGDKKAETFRAMTELLLDSEINDELRSKFSALSNDVLRLELDIFQGPESSAGNFLGPKTIEQITPIAHAFIEYLGFLDETLEKEARDAQSVKRAVVHAASDQTASLEMRFRGMIRPILRNLKRPRPAEHRILQTFIDLFDAYVYSDFLNVYNYQVIHDKVLYDERMAVSRLLITIWAVLQRTVGNYKAIMMVNDELKAQFISPAMGQIANYKAIWDDENALYRKEVDGGVRLGP